MRASNKRCKTVCETSRLVRQAGWWRPTGSALLSTGPARAMVLLAHASSGSPSPLGSPKRLHQIIEDIRKQPQAGGEGVQLILQARKDEVQYGKGYWLTTLLATEGRAWPLEPLLTFGAYSVIAAAALTSQPEWLRTNTPVISALQTAVNTIGVALFFLQGFKTNASYDRWYEGRKLWGVIATGLWVTASMIAGGSVKSPARAREILVWNLLLAITLKNALRGEEAVPEADSFGLSESDRAVLMSTPVLQRPLLCTSRINRALTSAFQASEHHNPSDIVRMRIQVEKMTEALPAMNRVQNTPTPFAYTVHLRSFIVLWLAAMPVIYSASLGWGAVPVSLAIAYAILGIEAISLEIEAPFGKDFNDLPLDDLVQGMCINALLVAGPAIDWDAPPEP